jgi:hypothetical protein
MQTLSAVRYLNLIPPHLKKRAKPAFQVLSFKCCVASVGEAFVVYKHRLAGFCIDHPDAAVATLFVWPTIFWGDPIMVEYSDRIRPPSRRKRATLTVR